MTTEKIEELQKELSTTKYNKKTQHHIGLIKAKIAMLKEKEASSSSGGSKEGYSVKKTGDATVVIVGFPSVGKSSLLNILTNADSEIGSYEFTTLNVIPGMLNYKHAKIQLLDLPGLIEGAAEGKGRGKEIISVMRNADLLLILIDATQPKHNSLIQKEIFEAGLRLNKTRPDVRITKTSKDGIKIASTVKLDLTRDTIRDVLRTFKYNNAHILIRSKVTIDELIDCIENNKKYTAAITVINKIDKNYNKEKIKKLNPDLKISTITKTNISQLKKLIFERLNFIRIFMKEPGKPADLTEPLIMKKNDTVRNVCINLHKDFLKNFKSCKITGPSARFPEQKLGLEHKLKDKDILEIHLN